MGASPKIAMVMAAGLGTRMRPITDIMPKPLVKVAGKTLLDWGLDALAEAGVETAIVNVHYLPQQIIDHVRSRRAPHVIISDETDQLLDSGGAVVKARELLGDEPFFTLNADTFWMEEPDVAAADHNLRRLARAWNGDKMDILLMVADMKETTGHVGGADFSIAADGHLKRTRGAPEGVIYAGASVTQIKMFANPPEGPHSLNHYFFAGIETGRTYGMVMDGHWITVGTPDAIAPAEAAVHRALAASS